MRLMCRAFLSNQCVCESRGGGTPKAQSSSGDMGLEVKRVLDSFTAEFSNETTKPEREIVANRTPHERPNHYEIGVRLDRRMGR